MSLVEGHPTSPVELRTFGKDLHAWKHTKFRLHRYDSSGEEKFVTNSLIK